MSCLQFDKEAGRAAVLRDVDDTAFSAYGNVLPRLHSNNRWRSGVAFNHIRFYDGLPRFSWSQFFGAFCNIASRYAGFDTQTSLAASVPSPRIPARMITGCPDTLGHEFGRQRRSPVQDFFIGNLPLKRPDSSLGTLLRSTTLRT